MEWFTLTNTKERFPSKAWCWVLIFSGNSKGIEVSHSWPKVSGLVLVLLFGASRNRNGSSTIGWSRTRTRSGQSNWQKELALHKEKFSPNPFQKKVNLRPKGLRVYRSLRSLFSFLHSLDLKVSFVQVFILPFVHYRSLTLIPSNNKWTVTSLLFSVTHCRSFTSFSRL